MEKYEKVPDKEVRKRNNNSKGMTGLIVFIVIVVLIIIGSCFSSTESKKTRCDMCGSDEKVFNIDGRNVCEDCWEKVKKIRDAYKYRWDVYDKIVNYKCLFWFLDVYK